MEISFHLHVFDHSTGYNLFDFDKCQFYDIYQKTGAHMSRPHVHLIVSVRVYWCHMWRCYLMWLSGFESDYLAFKYPVLFFSLRSDFLSLKKEQQQQQQQKKKKKKKKNTD